jgi:hypothetical protein
MQFLSIVYNHQEVAWKGNLLMIIYDLNIKSYFSSNIGLSEIHFNRSPTSLKVKPAAVADAILLRCHRYWLINGQKIYNKFCTL